MTEATKTHEGTQRDLPLAAEVFAVIGAAMEVHRVLGPGFLEAVYEEAFALELALRGIPVQRQAQMEIRYKGQTLSKRYVCDLVAYGSILIELKAIPQLGSIESAQILNYLKATNCPIGLLINFGKTGKLEWFRFAGAALH